MAIDKMTFIDMRGSSQYLDDVLIRCVSSGLFHPENAAGFSEYSIGSSVLSQNPFGELYSKMGDIAGTVGIPLEQMSTSCSVPTSSREDFLKDADSFFTQLQKEYPTYLNQKTELEEKLLHASPQTKEMLHQELKKLKETTQNQREAFSCWFSQLSLFHDAYELRKYVVEIRGVFHVVGFVTTRTEKEFISLFEGYPEITITAKDAGQDRHLPVQVPVKLKNNWFVRPFEMFVEMYGSPSYNDIDPTPFVAYTYTLLFGIMFGDLGQGLLISLIGYLLYRFKGMKLGAIISRIGISSAIFGTAYGSVFGFEEALTPLYTKLFGLHEKPIEVMRPATTNTVLITSVGIGVVIILMVIIFNICIGIKQHNLERTLFSQNGLAGLLFYGTVIAAVLLSLTGQSVSPVFWIIIVFSLVVIFFKEPLGRCVALWDHSTLIEKDQELKESRTFHPGAVNLVKLFSCKNLYIRFGRLPTENFQKLDFFTQTPFIVHPLKTDVEYVWCIYITSGPDKAEVDAIFHDLFFERIYIPESYLVSNEQTEEFLTRCIEAGGLPSDIAPSPKSTTVTISKHRTMLQIMFPDGIGAFFIETFFEMFEVLLSFITNTMSFLRVGGFILSHAGMMSVVMTLSAMMGSGGSLNWGVVIGGNLFVMALEGLIVGIQVLRLEFYEIFSRFFNADGAPFDPIRAGTTSV
ncbi:V-type ATPase 116kDa subunit family protein [Oscillospiraceae bacterium MB08-C2-2]|nr:V-type ATPase 116kDa subunit family protein [Oscillospiraceae bacterium MB08-C2-2]